MKPSHVHGATVLAVLGGLVAMMAGIIPEVAGLALLGVSKVTAAISAAAATGHAHLTRSAHDPRDRLIYAALTLAALAVLVWSTVTAWSSFDWPLWALIALLLLLIVPAFKARGASA